MMQLSFFQALKIHWPEYLVEAWGLGTFMVSACFFAVFFYHPRSVVGLGNDYVLNALMGLMMGLTAVAVILSPLGKRSGAHINPAVTLTFFRLGKIRFWDALFYVLFQFIGGTAGVFLSWILLGNWLEDSAVNFVVTVPGKEGLGVAFFAEFVISFLLMGMILVTTNSTRLMKYTAWLAGILIMLFIAFEARYSGMSMNPARSFASALVANYWTALWIYFVSPVVAMFFAAEIFTKLKGAEGVKCAKLHHHNKQRCIFCGKPSGSHNPEE